jgi:hypothetical protein
MGSGLKKRERALMRVVDRAIEHTLQLGCAKCAKPTELRASQSIEFPDGSLCVEIMHGCEVCGRAHVTFFADGAEARSFADGMIAEERRTGACYEVDRVTH